MIVSASKLSQIRNCITAVNATFLFFSVSHKRQDYLENVIDIILEKDSSEINRRRQYKLKGLCKTRWVERFEAIANFVDLSAAVMTACEAMLYPHLFVDDEKMSALIQQEWKWDADLLKLRHRSFSLVSENSIIVSLVVLKNVLHPLREITIN